MISDGRGKVPTTVSPKAVGRKGEWTSTSTTVPTYYSNKPVAYTRSISPTSATGVLTRAEKSRFRGSAASAAGTMAATAASSSLSLNTNGNHHNGSLEEKEALLEAGARASPSVLPAGLMSDPSTHSSPERKTSSSKPSSSSTGGDPMMIPTSPAAVTAKSAASASNQAPGGAAVQFWTIAAAVTLIFLLHGWLAEMLVIAVVNNGYSLGWFFAFLTVLGQWLPTIPRRGWNKSEFRVEHVIVGTAHCLSLGMSNSGGMLVEYNTYSLFKSGKVVFVMMVSWAMLGVQPSTQEVGWGLGLMLGLIMLTGADETYHEESQRATSPVTGAALLFAGISGNALVSVGQQAALQRRSLQKNTRASSSLLALQCPYVWGPQNSLPPPPGTAMPSKDDEREALLFYSNCISIVMLGGVCLLNGEMQQGIRFFTETATLKMWAAQAMAMALVAFGQRLVLTLNGTYGATASAAVLTFRKVASFVTSVFVFPKPFHPFHAIGLFVVVTSAVMIQRSEAHSASQRKMKGESGGVALSKANKVQESV